MARLDTDLFRLVSSSALQSQLDAVIGPKTLVLDPTLAGPLGLVTEVGLLKNHGVTKMFWLEQGALSNAERNIVYLCRPESRWMRIIADQIKTAGTNPHNYHLLVVPRLTEICSNLLEELGVLSSLEIQEFQLGLIPLEQDVLSLESEDVWRKLAMEGDYTPVYDMGKALMTLQRAFGLIPRVIGKGDSAKRLSSILRRLRKELPLTSLAATPLVPGLIDAMIVIDRHVDLVTPLCTQLTYEGLVDEMIGIKNSHVEVDPVLLNPAPSASTSTPVSQPTIAQKKKKHLLASSSDPLFALLRDQNFAVVGGILNRTARRLNEEYEKRHLAKTPGELRAFVGQLGGLQGEHQALRLHTGLTEEVMKVTAGESFNAALEIQQNLLAGIALPLQETLIRDLITQQSPLLVVLRLLCLYCLVSGGLKPKTIEEFKREILQAYGYHLLPLLTALSLPSLSLLSPPPPNARSPKSAFSLARKPLRLIVDDINELEPADMAYVFSGYAPLGCRIVQCALGALNGKSEVGWMGKGIDEVLKALPGECFEDTQSDETGGGFNAGKKSDSIPTTIICFLGGITFAEISALRFLGKILRDRNLLIITTDVIQGSNLLGSPIPEPLRAEFLKNATASTSI